MEQKLASDLVLGLGHKFESALKDSGSGLRLYFHSMVQKDKLALQCLELLFKSFSFVTKHNSSSQPLSS